MNGACWEPPAPHLLLEFSYLVFEVSDVLAGVRVVQLPLHSSFFLLRGIKRKTNQLDQLQHSMCSSKGQHPYFHAVVQSAWRATFPILNHSLIHDSLWFIRADVLSWWGVTCFYFLYYRPSPAQWKLLFSLRLRLVLGVSIALTG